MIQLYHGDGKGKTTAAVGAAVRAAGRGRLVIYARFMKGQESGELAVLSGLKNVRVLRLQKDFPFFAKMTEDEKRELRQIHDCILGQILETLETGQADFAVLDEITHAQRYGLLGEGKLDQILAFGKGRETEIVLTGRGPSEKLLESSDYITELCCKRHPYTQGVGARVGIEL